VRHNTKITAIGLTSSLICVLIFLISFQAKAGSSDSDSDSQFFYLYGGYGKSTDLYSIIIGKEIQNDFFGGFLFRARKKSSIYAGFEFDVFSITADRNVLKASLVTTKIIEAGFIRYKIGLGVPFYYAYDTSGKSYWGAGILARFSVGIHFASIVEIFIRICPEFMFLIRAPDNSIEYLVPFFLLRVTPGISISF